MLAWLQSAGSHHDIGLALGRWGAEACRTHLLGSPAWAEIQQWRGSPQAAAMRANVDLFFPWIRDELEGLAEGLGLSFDEVFLWNCRGDLWALAPDGCTTVLAPGRLAHNEDGHPGFAGRCGLAELRPSGAPAFVSFVYPGSIPGHAFAVSDTGLAMTVNNIRARRSTTGVPRMVLTRAILAVRDPDQAVALLRAYPRAGAFHLGIGMAGAGATHSVEFSAADVSSEQVGQRRLHANHAIHAAQATLPQIITASSRHRQERGEWLLARGAGALDILADQGDAAEPIYRDSVEDTDDENTMATIDIDLSGPLASWTVYGPPGRAQYRGEGIRRV
ncbi:C45 family peptidase [Castellaniella sp. GW247-6E4]|uniref:C45 family peptidase n=1 Tax=Castellaniella sp. GW247-6E4 TaxID=3140380 RepID=UPI00331482E4